MKKLFITATDTDAGKTFVSCAIIESLKQQSKQIAVFKPISAGCDLVDGVLVNEDAKFLHEHANCQQSINEINPIAFKQPIAPHIAAQSAGCQITLESISEHFQQVKQRAADYVLVEGAGGWRLPIGFKNGDGQFLSDFVATEALPVILIVNMKLGCLNHALLTLQSIKQSGTECLGWIANCADDNTMDNLEENIEALQVLLQLPMIAHIPYFDSKLSYKEKIAQASALIDTSHL